MWLESVNISGVTDMATTRETLHHIIDDLSEDQLRLLIEAIPKIVVPEDDELLTPEELEAVEEGRKEFERGECVPLEEYLRALGAEDQMSVHRRDD